MLDEAEIRARIAAAGNRRATALADAEQALADIADLVDDALAAGITKVEISRLGKVSRPTLDAHIARRKT